MKITGNFIVDHIPLEITLMERSVQSVKSNRETSVKRDHFISTALVDIQVNGFVGNDLSDPTVTGTDVCEMVRELWRVGTGLICPTIVTNSFENISNSLKAVVKAYESDQRVADSILGIHLEGPYISEVDGPRGAHPLKHVRDPDWEEFQQLQDIAQGKICLVTLAPEKIGAIHFIEKLVENGIVVAIGHTNATAEDISAAISAGASLSTHLGNGAHAEIRRHPNYIWDQLAADELRASLIVDGHHLPASVVKSMIRAKTPKRCILISDAVSLAGLDSGNYEFAGSAVELTEDRVVRLAGTEYLAGSAIELVKGIENTIKFTGLSLQKVIPMATLHPLIILNEKERIEKMRDLFVFKYASESQEITPVATIVNGELVYYDNNINVRNEAECGTN
ncbi:N-acetylglucosamine-6-phosphate deacetylase [Candidatus Poribacteria bacterium]|nr:MAG: N-acetylglucosamine-6-phosphate deacetylase [Candidatus Poribacteria bacterium]